MVLPDINPLYSASGFFVGVLVGLTGVGGGALMTPLLVLLFGIHPTTAVGTDLLFACITKTGGTLVHGLSNTVDWKITRRLASGSERERVLPPAGDRPYRRVRHELPLRRRRILGACGGGGTANGDLG